MMPNLARALPDSVDMQSPGRTWDGVEAEYFRPASGEIVVPPLSSHLIVLHLGPPVDMTQRLGDGREREKLVVGGDSVVVPAGLASEWRWEQGTSRADSLHVYLEPSLISEAAEGVGVDPDAVEIVGGLGPRDPQIERIGRSFLPELEATRLPGDGLFAEALARALAVHLLREHSTLGWIAQRAALRKIGGGLTRLALRQVTDYVGDNLAGNLSLAEISRSVNISPYHFSRLFKESTGLSPHQYVIRQRVEKSKELLMTTGLPLHEVAVAAGFADQSHMGRHLKRILGVSPTRLRRG